ncbi:GxxExxY protein [Flavobacterium sp.]|uniref:GxxExxY protein n=1 Tax=Flavobacterium sp. TaxID=239 RepID=UPI00286EB185|nr:GxxExxY protein [Flavobacterium sp.]
MHKVDTEIHKDLDSLSYKIIGLAIEVHRQLGPGLLESAYQECLFYEIKNAGLVVEKEKILPISYKDIKLDYGYRIDLLVENKLVIELKTVETYTSVHFAQILTYLKLGNYPLGLLVNYNSKILKNNIKRFINTPENL